MECFQCNDQQRKFAVTFAIVVAEALNSHSGGGLWKAPKMRMFFQETIEDKADKTTLYRLLGTEKKLPEAILLR